MTRSPFIGIRMGIFMVCTIQSLILVSTEFSVSEHITETYLKMALFTSCLSTLMFSVMVVLSFLRKFENAPIFYIVSELPIICTIWILWVVTAALAIQKMRTFVPPGSPSARLAIQKIRVYIPSGPPAPCKFFISQSDIRKCEQLLSIEDLAIVIFAFLTVYIMVVLTSATVVHFRGDTRVWFRSVAHLRVTNNGQSNPPIPLTQQMAHPQPPPAAHAPSAPIAQT
ncbi:hypothetical protein BDZ97DRAFT_1810607 [Flammula alnicola]|nr:hypothetical protein BDZ97DRAFT_1810607 [Flammula alnicola]